MKFRFSPKLSVTALVLLVSSASLNQALSQPQGRRGGGQGGQQRPQGQQGRSVQRQNSGQQFSGANGWSGQNRQIPGVMGTITNGDTATGRLLIQSQQSGTNLIVQVTADTQITTQMAVTAADLQVNDQVMIPRMDNGNASEGSQGGGNRGGNRGDNRPPLDSMGQRPAPPQGNGFQRGSGQQSGSNANNSQNSNRPNGNGGGRPPTVGRVTALNPLTIAAEGGDAVTVTLSADARVMKLLSLTFNDLKIGDRIMAMGQADSNGVFVAHQLKVNTDMGQNSRGGNGQGAAQNSPQNGTMRGGQGQRGNGGQGGGAMPQGRRGQRRPNG